MIFTVTLMIMILRLRVYFLLCGRMVVWAKKTKTPGLSTSTTCAPCVTTTTTPSPTITQSLQATECSCPTTDETKKLNDSTPTAMTHTCPETTVQNCNCSQSSENPGANAMHREYEKCGAFSVGAIVGATIGGSLFGSVASFVVFILLCRKSLGDKNNTMFEGVRNLAYEGNREPVPTLSKESTQTSTAYTEINDEMPKTARITPIQKYEESETKDDVYNHLHSSEEMDRSDYYDHAGPAPSLSIIDDGYGVMSSESQFNGAYSQVDGKIMPSDYGIAGNNRTMNILPLKLLRQIETNLV